MKIYDYLLAGSFLFFVALSGTATAAAQKEAAPSPAEQKLISRQIASIRDPQERNAVATQGTAWLMTTYLCQSAARRALVRLGSSSSRFFLQDDKPESQRVINASLIQGRGQYQTKTNPIEWVTFTWECHLDPSTGKVRKFDVKTTNSVWTIP
ncbi:hypothetical protein [Gluconobacter cerinus]|uniref:DUF930 domain-containing protein n=1 Tax=Gluconobacter cerinus TaxID=38307 RepID=A0AAV5ND01_9PROT|nr:hypothetical protein [Gluconobacter cerinus]GBQ97546.1 hypothetical protein AA0229_0571 [Gluconobacter cerinus NRIC 0229]GLQ61824.1 hypothetical protein GCM10007867_06690 [Gluconobacter cerinus]